MREQQRNGNRLWSIRVGFLLQLLLVILGAVACKAEDDQDTKPNADLYFPPVGSEVWETLSPQSLGWCDSQLSGFRQFLDEQGTKAFMVLKDGKIVLEWYYGDFNAQSSHMWASAGKTVTAFLVGLAQENGLLDIRRPSSDYLGAGWTGMNLSQERAITPWHQMTMTTGLDFGVSNISCTTPSCLTFKAAPGTQWYYHNAPYTLLTNVVENASGQGINTFALTRLMAPIGMTGSYINLGFNRIFFSRARSMARFGILIQAQGDWNGQPIMRDKEYFRQMINSSQNLNPAYGYLWWLNGKNSVILPQTTISIPGSMFPDAPNDVIAALGANDQSLMISASEGLIVLRMGDPSGFSRLGGGFENEIWKRLANLSCR